MAASDTEVSQNSSLRGACKECVNDSDLANTARSSQSAACENPFSAVINSDRFDITGRRSVSHHAQLAGTGSSKVSTFAAFRRITDGSFWLPANLFFPDEQQYFELRKKRRVLV